MRSKIRNGVLITALLFVVRPLRGEFDQQVGAERKTSEAAELQPPDDVINGTLFCMEGPDPGRVASKSAKPRYSDVSYLYERVSTEGQHELYLASYSRNKRFAWLYVMQVRGDSKGYSLVWVNTAQVKLVGKEWRVEDTLGGDFTWDLMTKTANDLAKQPVQHLKIPEISPVNVQCNLPHSR
jgi:hypothetical protein